MKNPTFAKIRRAGLTPIRYHSGGAHSQNRHGWIVKDTGNGTLIVRLIGDEFNRRLSRDDARYVVTL
jgi:hypothetical protein